MIEITTSPRAPKETVKEGCIPAVYYGAQTKSTPIFIDAIAFTKAFKEAGESSSVVLVTSEGKESVMIQDAQRHPVKGHFIHADFYVLEKGQKVHVKTPIVFVGEAPIAKTGGVVVKVMHELSIEGEPAKLPHEFTVDISSLTSFDSVITVADLKLPAGIELYHISGEDVVASISQPEGELGDIAPVDLSAIEVEKKGKKDEESEVAA
jgi:large subunit ribosomal protein L25